MRAWYMGNLNYTARRDLCSGTIQTRPSRSWIERGYHQDPAGEECMCEDGRQNMFHHRLPHHQDQLFHRTLCDRRVLGKHDSPRPELFPFAGRHRIDDALQSVGDHPSTRI